MEQLDLDLNLPPEEDKINHPRHYMDSSLVIEPIVITSRLSFCQGNAVKYVFRAGSKPGASELEDLKKADFYMDYIFNNGFLHPYPEILKLLRFSSNPILQVLGSDDWVNPESVWTEFAKAIKERINQLENK